MSSFGVRPYAMADRATCLSLFDSNVPKYFSVDEREEFSAFLDSLPGPYLVLEGENGNVVACGGYALVDDGRRADLCWGMVRSDLHRRGLGRQLTLHRIDAALASPRMEVVALNTSQHTMHFYRGLGFEQLLIERDGYSPGLDRCEMRLHVDRRPATSQSGSPR